MFKKPKNDAITNLIERNLDYLVRFVIYRLGYRVEAEDLVHGAILRFLEKNSNNIKLQKCQAVSFQTRL